MSLKTLNRTGNELSFPAVQRAVLADEGRLPGMSFADQLQGLNMNPLRRKTLEILQVNVGKVCNQTCTHCHVDAGPDRKENMTAETAAQVIEFLRQSAVSILDITGGAPEMNPNFRDLVSAAKELGKQVIDRCNLTILLANGFTDLPEFLAEHGVNVVASLPCYLEDNCDAQRGDGVFSKSIQAIKRLNQLGYGRPDSGLKLDLVYNPVGFGLPPDQASLESLYREQLNQRFEIEFSQLFTITNMPVSRFLDDLIRQGEYDAYFQKLMGSFNPATINGLMCRNLVSIDWKGYLFDCDFNQMLDMPISIGRDRLHITELNDSMLLEHAIATGNHCYGCTAGCGSSCSGSLIGES